MAIVINAKGTSTTTFAIGKQGPQLVKNSNSLEIKNNDETLTVVDFDTSNGEITIDRDIADSGSPLQVIQNNASATGDVIVIGNDGTGDGIQIINTNDARGIFVDNGTSTLAAIDINNTGVGESIRVNTDKFIVDKDGNTTTQGIISAGTDAQDAVITAFDAPSADTSGHHIFITAGNGDGTGYGGNVNINAGVSGNNNANGGDIILNPGDGSGSGSNGYVRSNIVYDMSNGPDNAFATKGYVDSLYIPMTFLGEVDLAGSTSVDFETNISNYNSIEMYFYAIQPGSSSDYFALRVKVGGSYLTTNYFYTNMFSTSSLFDSSGGYNTTEIRIWENDVSGNSDNEESNGKIVLNNTANMVSGTRFGLTGNIQSIKNSSSDILCLSLSAFNNTTGVVQGLRFFTNTGTFDSGKIRIFGVN